MKDLSFCLTVSELFFYQALFNVEIRTEAKLVEMIGNITPRRWPHYGDSCVLRYPRNAHSTTNCPTVFCKFSQSRLLYYSLSTEICDMIPSMACMESMLEAWKNRD